MHAQYAMRLVELQWYDAVNGVLQGRVSESVSLTTECIGFARTRSNCLPASPTIKVFRDDSLSFAVFAFVTAKDT